MQMRELPILPADAFLVDKENPCFLRPPVQEASDILTPSYKLLSIKKPVDILILKVYKQFYYHWTLDPGFRIIKNEGHNLLST